MHIKFYQAIIRAAENQRKHTTYCEGESMRNVQSVTMIEASQGDSSPLLPFSKNSTISPTLSSSDAIFLKTVPAPSPNASSFFSESNLNSEKFRPETVSLLKGLINDSDPENMQPHQSFVYKLGLELVLDTHVLPKEDKKNIPDDLIILKNVSYGELKQHVEPFKFEMIKCPLKSCNFYTESSLVINFLLH